MSLDICEMKLAIPGCRLLPKNDHTVGVDSLEIWRQERDWRVGCSFDVLVASTVLFEDRRRGVAQTGRVQYAVT